MKLPRAFQTLACIPGLAFAVAGPSGGYQQYMDMYMGSGGASSGATSQEKHQQQPGQKFLDEFAKKYMGGNSSGNFQNFMTEYANKYMGGSNSSGNFKSFINEYANKYMGGSSSGGDFQNVINEYTRKFMQGSNSSGDFQNFVSEYAKKYMGGSNGGSQDFQNAANQYSGSPQDYMNANATNVQKHQEALEDDPSKCATAKCICAWHQQKVALLRGTVPAMMVNFSLDASKKEYKGLLEEYKGLLIQKKKYKGLLETFAAHHNTSVAKLGLTKSCKLDLPATVTGSVPAGHKTEALLASTSMWGSGTALPCVLLFLAGALQCRRKSRSRENVHDEDAYYLIA